MSALQNWAREGDTIEPPISFPPGVDPPILTFSSWSEVSQMCGDSRVWAGLHFEASDFVYARLSV